MKITKITAAVKTAGRYNIFIDGAYSFSLEEAQLLNEKLKIGLEIDESRLEALKGESDFGKKYARTLDLILRRPRSEKEINDYARKKDWEQEVLNKVKKKLINKGYIDDEKFARFWLNTRKGSVKPISRRKLQAELLQKGIDRGIVDSVLLDYSDEEELDSLKQLVDKKRSKYKDQQKLLAYLASKGYSFEKIKKALEMN